MLAALKELIAVPWSFSHVVREADAAGFERIKLRAAARVPQAENWNLAERARKVSREGLSIAVVDVSYAMSREQLRQIVAELRLELLRDATAHAKSMSEASGRDWRVGDVEFGIPDYGSDRQYTGKGASRDSCATAAGAVRWGRAVNVTVTAALFECKSADRHRQPYRRMASSPYRRYAFDGSRSL